MSSSSRRRVADRLPSPRRRSVLENLESRTLLHGGVGFETHVNFQPAGAVVPAGYVADTGTVFADRGGLAYGWNLSNASYTRERNSSLAPDQRYDTLNQMQRSGAGTVWELAVPNGTYSVRIVAGDPSAYDSTYAIAAEGVTVVAGKPTSTVRFFDGTKTVTVADGRLTLTNAAGSANNKIAFIDIHQEDAAALPTVSVTASDPSASEAGRDPATFVVTRQGDTAEALAVSFSVGGTATAGADYAALGGSVVIPAGAASAAVTVSPVDDAAAEDDETVVLTLLPSSAYDVAAPAGATVTIVDNDVPTQPGFSAKVNFQPAASPVPAGYLADGGNVFADRGNGFVYGWNVSNATYARDRNSSLSPDQRYDTLTQMRGTGNVWEISLPNGTYTVRIVAGDPSAYDSTYAIAAEGLTVVSGKPSSSVRWFDGTKTVTVADGRLTVTNAAGSSNNKIAFIDIAGAGGPTTPTVSVSASDALALENPPGNDGAFTVSRSGSTDAPLTVNLVVGGSATGGADYAALGTSVVIPAGASSVVVPVVPVDDALVEGNESVTLAVASGGGYDVGSPSSAAVTIADDDRPAGTTLSWREVSPATVGRSEAMGAVVNGKLYHFGGYVDTTYKPTTRADVYDPATNRWSQIASLPFGVSHAGTAVVGDSVYFAGGYPATNASQSFATVRVTRYDTTTNTYQTNLPSLPLARGGGALVAVGRKLHFIGGADSSRRDAAQHWALDLDNLAAGWVARAPLPVATNHVAGVTLGGTIYIVGGQQGQDAAAVHRADVQTYDPATDRWTARAPMPAAKSHITNATIVRDGRIIVLGGMGTGERVLSTVNSYDPLTNAWSSLTSLPTGRMSGVADLLPDGRIVFATGGSGFRTNTWIGSFA